MNGYLLLAPGDDIMSCSDLVEDRCGTFWKKFSSPRAETNLILCLRCGEQYFTGWQRLNDLELYVVCNNCLIRRDRG